MKKCSDVLLVIFIFIILSGGLLYSLLMRKDIIELENRSAYKYQNITLNNFVNKEFQNSVENALSDQLPLSISTKQTYNYIYSIFSKYLTELLIANKCEKKYFYYSKNFLTFDCNKYIVSKFRDSSSVTFRKDNIQSIIDKSRVPVYLYYIERYDDIDLENNRKTGLFDKLKSELSIDDKYISRFELESNDEYEKYFYQTDHHLNNVGAYKAYTDIITMLGEKKEMEIIDETCHKYKMSGSTARTNKVYGLFNEEFCIYNFDYPKHETMINGQDGEYGTDRIDNSSLPNYAKYAGFDYGEVVFDFNQPNKKNILVLGNSYDNAYVKLLATHFNKTFVVDMRHYKDDEGMDFDYLDYIKKNKIGLVLLNGDVGYFGNNIYEFEVK